MSKQTFRVVKQEGGMKLLSFLRQHCSESISAKAIKRAINAKKCRVNTRIETISTRPLKVHDCVEIELTVQEKSLPTILFEDADLLVINKTPQVICENRAINALFPKYQGKLHLIHRLDKETSGVLLIAKKESFKEKMIPLFRKREVKKIYLAIVDGVVDSKAGKCEGRLAKKSGHGNKAVWGTVKSKEGKESLSLWKCLETGKRASYLELRPVSGRTHQLRVHMSEMGHPILGDVQYRHKRFRCHYQPQRNLLHAASIEFIHPITENAICIKAPLPKDFKQAQAKLFS